MSDLPRLIDDEGSDPELARLLRAGRPPVALPRAVFERSRSRVLGLASAPAATGTLAWVRYAALGAALGSSVALAAALPRILVESPMAPATPPSASAARTLPIHAPLGHVPEPRPSSVAAPSAPLGIERHPASSAPLGIEAHPAPSATIEHQLVRETRLLEKARGELERRPDLCLELLREHAREFPSGALAVERQFLSVASLLRLGRRSEAEAHAAALRARTPGSLYEERLDRILGDGAPP